MFVAFFGGFRAARVDANQLGPVAFGQLNIAPKMQVAGNRIAAPDQNQIGVGKKLDPHADFAAKSLGQAFGSGRRTNGAIQLRRAELVEKPRGHALALHRTHGAAIAVRLNRFSGIRRAGGNGFKPRSDIAQSAFPAHPLELPRTLRAAAFKRVQQPLRVVNALGIARHFGAQHAAGLRMRGVALHLQGDAVFNDGDQGAGVRAVVRAGTQHLGGVANLQIFLHGKQSSVHGVMEFTQERGSMYCELTGACG